MEIDTLTQAKEKLFKIKNGFRIVQVVIRDQDTGEIYWDSKAHIQSDYIETSQLLEAYLPARMLHSKAITRQVTFSSIEKMHKLNLSQKAFLGNELVECFTFNFGFVIPNSVNNWDQTILIAEPDQIIPIHILSGNLVMAITFFEELEPIYEVRLKIFYE